jgi:hypothetical protein
MTNKIKNIKLILATIFSFLFVISFVLPNTKLNLVRAFSRAMPSILILDDSDSGNSPFAGDKGKTPFDHDQHISTRANTTCVTCHHTNSNDLSVAIEEDVPKCTSCHTKDSSPSTSKGTNQNKDFLGKIAISSEEAFHGKGSDIGCIGCHDNRGIEPRTCKDCHSGEDKVNYIITPLFPEVKDKLKPVAKAQTSSNTTEINNTESLAKTLETGEKQPN